MIHALNATADCSPLPTAVRLLRNQTLSDIDLCVLAAYLDAADCAPAQRPPEYLLVKRRFHLEARSRLKANPNWCPVHSGALEDFREQVLDEQMSALDAAAESQQLPELCA